MSTLPVAPARSPLFVWPAAVACSYRGLPSLSHFSLPHIQQGPLLKSVTRLIDVVQASSRVQTSSLSVVPRQVPNSNTSFNSVKPAKTLLHLGQPRLPIHDRHRGYLTLVRCLLQVSAKTINHSSRASPGFQDPSTTTADTLFCTIRAPHLSCTGPPISHDIFEGSQPLLAYGAA